MELCVWLDRGRVVDVAEEWEGIAADILGETGCDSPPVDALELAACCGLSAKPWGRAYARLNRKRAEIRYPAAARLTRQHGLVAHEIGHWALVRGGADNDEDGARYLAGALLLPRRHFDRDLTRTSWAMAELRAKHVHASVEMIARRVCQLRDAVVTIVDEGRVRERIASAWLTEPRLHRMSRWERELVDRALETGETAHGDQLCYAVPLIDPPHRRVIVVCEAEQLSLKL